MTTGSPTPTTSRASRGHRLAPLQPAVPASSPPTAGASAPRTLRLDIQALRAFAVIAVVIYHVWPTALPGGFIGVDVFFVISGFLITGHIYHEITRTGRLALPRFYAKRARRILPPAFLILIASTVAALIFLPQTGGQPPQQKESRRSFTCRTCSSRTPRSITSPRTPRTPCSCTFGRSRSRNSSTSWFPCS